MTTETLREILDTSTVSPYREILAYEFLYSLDNSNLKRITEETVLSDKLPSQVMIEKSGFLEPDSLPEIEKLIKSKIGRLSVAVNNTPSWPDKLADSSRPTPLFYYYGNIGLMDSRSISIVGSRKASEAGLKHASNLAKELVSKGMTIVSGLAAGVDTAALTSAIENGGNVIGVIGTPIDEFYPKSNKGLQDTISNNHLLVSQVPFYRYSIQPFETKRYYFPERNELMAAISDATIIVEASDTSGTLTQARACMHQNRPLFILKSCYENNAVTWPRKWSSRENVFVVDDADSILAILDKDLQECNLSSQIA